MLSILKISAMLAPIPTLTPLLRRLIVTVGLMTTDAPADGEDIGTHSILMDIQGTEDHYGDMDFKVAGTAEGITAIQVSRIFFSFCSYRCFRLLTMPWCSLFRFWLFSSGVRYFYCCCNLAVMPLFFINFRFRAFFVVVPCVLFSSL